MKLLDIHEPGETPLPHEDTRAIGIDLGTTHSVIAIAEDGKADIITTRQKERLVPSVVEYNEQGQKVAVGGAALASAEKGKKLAIRSIKRRMSEMPTLNVGARKMTPVEISADILRHLKAQAEEALGHEVKQAVVTVPAYFDDTARTATKDAARLAGLEVLRLLNEPTAAALAYGLEHGAEGIYAIYDLGGGTFDISLLKLSKGVFQVLSTGGDTALGGDDFDQAILSYVLQKSGIRELDDEKKGAFFAEARRIKERLSDMTEASFSLNVPEEIKMASSPCSTEHVLIHRTDFEKLIAAPVQKTIALCKRAITDAGVEKGDIKGVVLVGGSTRIPYVREQVEAFFGTRPLTNIDPDEVVAIGAALQAEALTRGSDTLLLDVIPLSLGLETMGGLTEKIISRNTAIPVSHAQEFTTYKDGQTGMVIHVVQGEREMVEQNRSLAKFELKGIPPLPAGITRVKVTFSVDADGLLTVSATEETTGVRQRVEVKPSYGLSPEDMERMLRESMEHAANDMTTRLLAEARMEAGRILIEVESAMKQDSALLSDKEKQSIHDRMQAVHEAIKKDGRDAIRAASLALEEATQSFAEKRMNAAIGRALKGKQVAEM